MLNKNKFNERRFIILFRFLTFFLFSYSSLTASSYSGYSEDNLSWDKPHSYPLYLVRYDKLGDEAAEFCQVKDFRKNCAQLDGQCKAIKGLCGEILSKIFFLENWTKIEGHYSGNQGFDGLYKVNSTHVKYVVVEDKAGTACLKKYQMSLWWQADRAKKLYESRINQEQNRNKRLLTTEEHKEFQNALQEGQVIGLLTRTTYKDLSSSSPQRYKFLMKVYLLGDPKWSEGFQNKYIRNYSTIHPYNIYDQYHFYYINNLFIVKKSQVEQENDQVLEDVYNSSESNLRLYFK